MEERNVFILIDRQQEFAALKSFWINLNDVCEAEEKLMVFEKKTKLLLGFRR